MPEVKAVRASLPIAVLFPPLTEASKALSPRTVLPATEFAPLPIATLFILASAVEVNEPSKPHKVIQASLALFLIFNKAFEVSAHNI